MRRHLPLAVKLLCVVLALAVVRELHGMATAEDPLAGLDLAALRTLARPVAAATSEAGKASDEKPGKEAAARPARPGRSPTPKPAPLPPAYQPIVKRPIFGTKPAPKPIPILLEGIGDDYAFIRSGRGRSGLVRIGGTFDGIKLLAIAQNRALVEVKGERKELTMYGGLGSESLLPRKAGKTPAGTAAPARKPPPVRTEPGKPPGGKPGRKPGENPGRKP